MEKLQSWFKERSSKNLLIVLTGPLIVCINKILLKQHVCLFTYGSGILWLIDGCVERLQQRLYHKKPLLAGPLQYMCCLGYESAFMVPR